MEARVRGWGRVDLLTCSMPCRAFQILSLFFAEFDNVAGPKILYQSPVGFLSDDDFDMVAAYLILSLEAGGGEPSSGGGSAGAVVQKHVAPTATASGAGAGAASAASGDGAEAATSASAALLPQATAPSPPPSPSPPPTPAPAPSASAPPLPVPTPSPLEAAAGGLPPRVISVEHPGLSRPAVTIVGFPVALQNDKYARNSLLFSVGLVLPAGADAGPYGSVLAKLGMLLQRMEADSEFLFRSEKKAQLATILPAILRGLNERGECFIEVDACDSIALKLFPTSLLPPPPPVRPHDVPVRLRDLDALALGFGDGGDEGSRGGDGFDDDSGWDLGLRMVLPHIDGASHVRAVAERADVDQGVVRRAVQHLIYYGCVGLVDVFQFANVYAATHRLQALLHSPPLRRACMQYVVASTPPPSFEDVFRLLAAFGAGCSVGDLLLRPGASAAGARGVDARRLVVFGVLHGLLRRIHRYPVRKMSIEDESAQVGATAAAGAELFISPAVLQMLDGSMSLEALCCKLKVGQATVEAALLRGGYSFVDR